MLSENKNLAIKRLLHTFELKAADLHLPQARAMLIRKGEGSCTGIFIKPNEV
ncbi:conserved hypothetical protein [Alteromonas sp. 38]|nr:conserved hypothetical protein [Alteromonas sp. 154]VXB14711.1 conserved hypothetical protein [Alteromonas sp. 38]